MARAGSLIVQMAVDLAKFRSDMAGAAQISNTRLREIERSAKSTTDTLASVGNKMRTALGALGISVSVGAAVAVLKQAAVASLEYADAIDKAAAKTEMTKAQFARLSEALSLQDIEIEALSKSMRFMAQNLSRAAEGDKMAGEMFKALSLNAKELIKLDPQKQLEIITTQISRLGNVSDKAAIGVKMFGRGWDGTAHVFIQGGQAIRELTDEIDDLGLALNEVQLTKLADAEDAVKKLRIQNKLFAASIMSDILPPLIAWVQRLNDIRAAGGGVIEMMREAGRMMGRAALGIPQPPTERELKEAAETRRRLSVDASGLNADLMRNTITAPRPKGPEDEAAAARAAAAAKAAAAERVRELKTLQETYANVAKAGIEVMQDLESPADAIVRKFEEQRAALMDMADTYPGLKTAALDALGTAAVIADDALEALKGLTPEQARHNELMLQYLDLVKQARTPTEEWADEVMRLTDILRETGDMETFKRGLAEANDELKQASKEMTTLSVFAEQAARNMQDSFARFLFDPFKEGLDGMLAGFLDTIRQMAAEMAAQELLMSFFSWAGGGITSGVRGFFTGMGKSLTPRAGGGPVSAGGAFLVGEHGPEMLMMGSKSGHIYPDLGGMGGMVFAPVYNIDARGADADRIMAMMPGLLKQTKDQTIAEVKGLIGRGKL